MTKPFNCEDDLFACLKDNFSPEAVAAIASCLQTFVSTVGTVPEVDSQLNWLADGLVTLLGGQEIYAHICEEIGL